jgi:hypothetical protein
MQWGYDEDEELADQVFSESGRVIANVEDDDECKHIATFDPPAVIALLDALEKTRERSHDQHRGYMQIIRCEIKQELATATTNLAEKDAEIARLKHEQSHLVDSAAGCSARSGRRCEVEKVLDIFRFGGAS